MDSVCHLNAHILMLIYLCMYTHIYYFIDVKVCLILTVFFK